MPLVYDAEYGRYRRASNVDARGVPLISKGAISELVACAELLTHGYQVFRNVAQHGTYDLVAIKGEDVLYIDVKSGTRLPNGRLLFPYLSMPDPRLTYAVVLENREMILLSATEYTAQVKRKPRQR